MLGCYAFISSCISSQNSSKQRSNYLNAHLHLGFLQREVDAGDSGFRDALWHLLAGDGAVKSVAIDEHRLARGPTVRLEHVHRLDRVFDA